MRRKTRSVRIGNVKVGWPAPVSVQSMTKTDTRDVDATLQQICELQKAGCEIIRIAVPDREASKAFTEIKKKAKIPVVADIHYNYKLAIEAIKGGADAIRLNPGNIWRKDEVKKIAGEAKKARIPIRVGVNSGSIRKGEIFTSLEEEDMVNSAISYTQLLEKFNFHDIIVSLKASDVQRTVRAYEIMAEKCDYPFHLGLTAAGPPGAGTIKSAVALGILLSRGIGDTVRVSLTGDPEEEVLVAYEILSSLGLRKKGPDIISCPTCGRCNVDLVKIVQEVGDKLNRVDFHDDLNGIKIAVMGCPVNGPGEAREADIGIACGRDTARLFKKGKITKRVSKRKIVSTLLSELKML